MLDLIEKGMAYHALASKMAPSEMAAGNNDVKTLVYLQPFN